MLAIELLLRRSKASPSSLLTHTSMGGSGCFPGSFAMDVRTQDEFMDAYAAALDAGRQAQAQAIVDLSIVERHRHIGPVVVDIDLRQAGHARAYDAPTLLAFVRRLFDALGDLVRVPEGARCFLLEKPGD